MIINLNNQYAAAQTITEYCVFFVVVALVLVFAINGPIRTSLNTVFNGLVEDVSVALNKVAG